MPIVLHPARATSFYLHTTSETQNTALPLLDEKRGTRQILFGLFFIIKGACEWPMTNKLYCEIVGVGQGGPWYALEKTLR